MVPSSRKRCASASFFAIGLTKMRGPPFWSTAICACATGAGGGGGGAATGTGAGGGGAAAAGAFAGAALPAC